MRKRALIFMVAAISAMTQTTAYATEVQEIDPLIPETESESHVLRIKITAGGSLTINRGKDQERTITVSADEDYIYVYDSSDHLVESIDAEESDYTYEYETSRTVTLEAVADDGYTISESVGMNDTEYLDEMTDLTSTTFLNEDKFVGVAFEEKTDTGGLTVEANYSESTGGIMYIIHAGKFTEMEDATKLANEIKGKGVDATVDLSGEQYVVQCGSFSEREKADNIMEKLKSLKYNAVMQVVDTTPVAETEAAGSTGALGDMLGTTLGTTAGEKVVAQARTYANIMIRDQWVYSNSNNKWNWTDAGNAAKKVSNCALFASHVLQATGHLNYNQAFYFKKDGSVVSRNGGWEQLMRTCDIMMYSGTSVSSLALCPGDILGYSGHVNIFAGYNEDGVATWIDAGRGGTLSCAADSPFTSNMYKTGNMDGSKVYAVIRPK